eukprot:augustus_masked-scaffold_5-processed-gene-10.53-mRNA-1 protein AED:1.00 eAED:1.00 QI:0/0/0/0/1/1/5/0/668
MAPPGTQKKGKKPSHEAEKPDKKNKTAGQEAMTPEIDKNEDEVLMETHSDREVSLTVEEVKTLLEQEHNKEVPMPQETEASNPLALEQEVSRQLVKAFSPTGAVTQSIKTQLQAILTSDLPKKKIEKDEESSSPTTTYEKRPKKSKVHKNMLKSSRKSTTEPKQTSLSDHSRFSEELLTESDSGSISSGVTKANLSAFMHEFMTLKQNVKGIKIQTFLSKKVYDTLKAKGVNAQATRAVEAYLENRRTKFKARNKKNAMKRMKDNLTWPRNVRGGDEHVDNFFDDVDMLLSDLTPKEKKLHFKKSIKIMVNALPSSFEISADEVSSNKQLWSMKDFKELLYSRSFVAEKQKPKVRATKVTKSEKPSIAKPEHEVKKVKVIKLIRLGEEAHKLHLHLKNVKTGSFKAVNGIADTGSDRNIAPLSIIPKFVKLVEDPQYVFEIEFPDKTRYKAKKVILSDAMLIGKKKQENTSLVPENDFKERVELFKLFKKILNTQELKVDTVTIKNEATKIAKLEITPLSEIDTIMADELAELLDQQRDINSILIKNMLDQIPDEFNEKGLGEGNISVEQEKENMGKMISQKVEASGATKDQKAYLESILRANLSSLGLEHSNARMSYLTPIEVDLVPRHKVIKCSGYHFTNEEEEFIQRKFISLQKGGIAEPSNNPL